MSKSREMPGPIVRTRSKQSTTGYVHIGEMIFPCALGRSGSKALKREGDGATPVGTWSLLNVLYRPDRIPRPRTALLVSTINPNDGWCDAPGNANYNRPVKLPYSASAENLWRDDHLYDLLVVLDYNITTRTQGLGSAIFMHVAQQGFKPTEGCIALTRNHLTQLLAMVRPGSTLLVS